MENTSSFIVKVILTWSKSMAIVIFAVGAIIDFQEKTGGVNFRYSLPFVAAMIGVKQIGDAWVKSRNNG